MIESTLSSYGGSAQQAADSRNTQESLNQYGKWQIRQEHKKVIFYTTHLGPAPCLPTPVCYRQRQALSRERPTLAKGER